MDIKIGIIGIGKWGQNYVSACKKIRANIKWICSSTQETLDRVANNFQLKKEARTTTNYKDILKDKEVDAVIIATPGSTHYQIAKKALNAGKHVLVEKPVAFSAKEARNLIVISKKKNKIFMAGHIHLYNPHIRKLKHDIKSGLFGKIQYIQSFGSSALNVREDISVLWDFFPHDASILIYLLDAMPIKVSANGAALIKEGREDIAIMNLWFPNNIFAAAMATWLNPVKKRKVIVIGEKMPAMFDDYSEIKLKCFKDGIQSIPHVIPSKPLTNQLTHFLHCIKNNKIPLTDGKEALKVTRVLEAAQKSLKENGKFVEV